MRDVGDLLDLASRQHGLFTRQQAADAGLDRFAVERRRQRGMIVRVSTQVWALAGAPRDDDQLAMAAVLDAGPGAGLAVHTAAAMWQQPGYEMTPPQVIVPRGRRIPASSLAIVHTSTFLPPHHLTMVRGIPVTLPTRTAFDLSGRVHPRRLERTIERMWSRRLTNGPKLYRMLDELSEHGRLRIQAIRDYLEPRGPSYVPMDSHLEMRVNELLVADGQRGVDHQVDVGDEHEWIGRVDFIDRLLKIIIEVDSELFHGSDLDRRLDEERTKRLEDAGWTVVRVRELDVWHNPSVVVAQVRDARRRATLKTA